MRQIIGYKTWECFGHELANVFAPEVIRNIPEREIGNQESRT